MRMGDRAFDLVAFGRAIESGDVDYQLARYADNAQVQVRKVDPENNSPGPMLQMLGASAGRETQNSGVSDLRRCASQLAFPSGRASSVSTLTSVALEQSRQRCAGV